MSTILHIETSTKNCSVSIANCGELISLKEINTGDYSHAEMLHPLINKALQESKLTIKDIEAIAVGKGPRILHWFTYWCFCRKRIVFC